MHTTINKTSPPKRYVKLQLQPATVVRCWNVFAQNSGGAIVKRSKSKRELWDATINIDRQVSEALAYRERARIGFAKVKVVGEGVELAASHLIQRPISMSHVNALLASFNHSGCLPFEIENVVVIAVRTGWVNPSSVSREPTRGLRSLRFSSLPTGERPKLLNGQHRIQALNKRLKPLVLQAEQLEDKIGTADVGDARKKMEEELLELRYTIEASSWWGAVIYNLGASASE